MIARLCSVAAAFALSASASVSSASVSSASVSSASVASASDPAAGEAPGWELSVERCRMGPGPGCFCTWRPPHPTTLAAEGRSCFPRFDGSAEPLDAERRARMTGVSWHPGCPVGLDELVLLRLPHWTFDGGLRRGALVVRASVADEVLRAFRHLYEARFPIERMEPVEAFGGDDHRSMAANNTSAFNCRKTEGGRGFSEHARGEAVDLNPVQNPYVRGATVLPPEGAGAVERIPRLGMLVEGGPGVAAFDAVRWSWGGRWKRVRDYQHFSRSGR